MVIWGKNISNKTDKENNVKMTTLGVKHQIAVQNLYTFKFN